MKCALDCVHACLAKCAHADGRGSACYSECTKPCLPKCVDTSAAKPTSVAPLAVHVVHDRNASAAVRELLQRSSHAWTTAQHVQMDGASLAKAANAVLPGLADALRSLNDDTEASRQLWAFARLLAHRALVRLTRGRERERVGCAAKGEGM